MSSRLLEAIGDEGIRASLGKIEIGPETRRNLDRLVAILATSSPKAAAERVALEHLSQLADLGPSAIRNLDELWVRDL